MIKNEKLLNKISDYYKTKESEIASYNAYIEDELYKNEEYLSLENGARKLNYEIAKAEYLGNLELVKKLTPNRDLLIDKKSKIYKEFTKNIKFTYSCKLCNDTGFYKGNRCKCYYNLLTNFTIESLNVKKRNFPSFIGEIPSELAKHYEILKVFSEKFPNTEIKNFVFLGKVGTGKTYLAGCIASEIIKKEYLPVFLTATELNAIFLKMHKQEVDRELVFDVLTTCDLLIIDDLGTEPLYNNVTAEYLLSIISERLDKNKHFIITTNLSASEILARYNERFLSRISNKKQTAIIPFNGKDLRR